MTHPTMPLLLTLCGDRSDLTIKTVRLTAAAQRDVRDAFLKQEQAFCVGDEVAFDEDWLNDNKDLLVTRIPEDIRVFDLILDTPDTSLAPMSRDAKDWKEVRGLAIKANGTTGHERILVQAFSARHSFGQRGVVSLMAEKDTYAPLSSGFHLDDKLACIAQDGLLKFRSLHALGRVIDTSVILSIATDQDMRDFANDHSHLFEIPDPDAFATDVGLPARKSIARLIKSGDLGGHTVDTLQEAAQQARMPINVQNDRIQMPATSRDRNKLLRFLNDGQYIGPISGKTLVTNSKKPA